MTDNLITIDDKVWDWLAKTEADVAIDIHKQTSARITYIKATEVLDIYVLINDVRHELVGCIRRGSHFKFDVANPYQSVEVLQTVRKAVDGLVEAVERNIDTQASGMNYDWYNDQLKED